MIRSEGVSGALIGFFPLGIASRFFFFGGTGPDPVCFSTLAFPFLDRYPTGSSLFVLSHWEGPHKYPPSVEGLNFEIFFGKTLLRPLLSLFPPSFFLFFERRILRVKTWFLTWRPRVTNGGGFFPASASCPISNLFQLLSHRNSFLRQLTFAFLCKMGGLIRLHFFPPHQPCPALGWPHKTRYVLWFPLVADGVGP